MDVRLMALCLVLGYRCWAADAQPEDIIRRSVANMTNDWNAAPQYDFTERDVTVRNGNKSTKTYQVMMIEGSTYHKLIAVNGQPLSPADSAREETKLQHEIEHRRNESPAARQKRIAQYQNERRQDHALMAEISRAFDFTLAGQDTVNGRRCFTLNATPKPAYKPPNRETQVLKGMRGTLWVDTEQYQWVKVHAQVFRPVSFGLFIAKVKPGTEFTLEQTPLQGNLWLPSHFHMELKARVFLSSRDTLDDETYSNYHRAGKDAEKSASTQR